eukprot:Phypoly_transcript_03643.p1 GENE.Phypoly_transcript_03643~~Phypoly_transcript_03643.p1  ORF type:complete len:749 (+),score=76.92 Phypoly_transcript_03643:97-2343(+)
MNKVLLLLFGVIYLCNAARRGSFSPNVPKGYNLLPSHKRSTTSSEEISVVLGLKQRNLDKLEETFWAVSDPKNPEYGNHMSFTEVIDLIAPPQESVDTLINWMTENGIERGKIVLHESKDFLTVDMTVAQAESLFKAPQTPIVHKKSGRVAVRMGSGYELPAEVDGLVDFISSLNEIKNAPPVVLDLPTTPIAEGVSKKLTRGSRSAPDIISLYTLGESFIITGVVIFCPDGSYPYIIGNGQSQTLLCGGASLIAVIATVTDTISSSITTSQLAFGYCSECLYNSTCLETDYFDAVFCRLEGVEKLKNYVPYTLSLKTLWSDNSVSDSSPSQTVTCGEEVTPDIIQRTYSIPSGTQVTTKKNSQAVAEFSEGFLKSDAQVYFKMYNLPDMSNLISVRNSQYVVGAGTGEGILDVIAIMGTARNCPTVYWAEINAGNPFLTWIKDVLNHAKVAYVHSVSYTVAEIITGLDDPEFNVRTNVEFIKAGARGITILVASGDLGIHSSLRSGIPNFDPDFPASSPYVTSVGATQLAPSSADASCYDNNSNYTCPITEIVCSPETGALISSGGGFSNLWDIPAYQSSVVSTYLGGLSDTEKQQGFNTSGRGYPDISALGHDVQVVHAGQLTDVDGTSASAPFVAGMITLLNDIRFSNGRPSLGFINPLLYQMGASYFNDVTQGSNRCILGNCAEGFNATTGWDPVTGLGTPIFNKMADYVSNLTDYKPIASPSSSLQISSFVLFIFGLLACVLF